MNALKKFLNGIEITMGYYESVNDYMNPSGAYIMHVDGTRYSQINDIQHLTSGMSEEFMVLYKSGLSYVIRKYQDFPYLG